jgi:hypothetical protein
MKDMSEVFEKMPGFVKDLMGNLPGMEQRTYNIGDKGPGGGFIFYAEGGVYMEVTLTLGSYNWDQAVEVAKNYKGGGFTDWRLPSQSELNMIYQNLRKKNLAGLGDDTYWSSSQYPQLNGEPGFRDSAMAVGTASTRKYVFGSGRAGFLRERGSGGTLWGKKLRYQDSA